MASMITLVFGYFSLKASGMCFFTFSIEDHFSNGPSTCDIKDIHDVNILLTDDCDTLNINDKKVCV